MSDVLQLIGVGTVSAAALIAVIGATARFALLPLIRAKRMASAPPPAATDAGLSARMDAMEEEMRHLGQALERLAAVSEFDVQLRAGASRAPQLPEAGA